MESMTKDKDVAAGPTPTPAEIVAAARALASVCDGAVQDDERGYNGCDSPTVKSILSRETKTVRQIRALWNILRKYRGQLAGFGIAYDALVPPPLPVEAPQIPGAPKPAFVPQQTVVKLLLVDTEYGRRIALQFQYNADVVAKVKKTQKRWFDKEGKNSAKIQNAWLIPDDVDHLDALIGLLGEIEPAVKVELAPDLQVHAEAARAARLTAYAASRAESADIEVPTKLPLRPFQKAGVKWALDHDGRVLISDEPGLGKTAQALGFLMMQREALPALVVSPAGLRGNWVYEASKFTDFKCQILTAKSSLHMLRKAGFVANLLPEPGYDLTIMNYDMLSAETAKTWVKMLHGQDEKKVAYAHDNLVLAGRPAVELILKAMVKRPGLNIENRLNRAKDMIDALGDSARSMKQKRFVRCFVGDIAVEEFLKAGFQTVISDECHRLKDQKAQCSMAADVLFSEMKYVLGLTGTPILNRPMEAWHQIHLIAPEVFPSSFEFGKRFANGHLTHFGWDFSGASNLGELDMKLRTSIMIRRTKEQVLKELPQKIRITVTMTLADTMGDYEDEAKDPIKKLALLKKEREEWKAVLSTLTPEERTRYISEHAEKAANAQRISGLMMEEIEEVKQAAVRAKFDECVKFILELQAAQGKIIVFMSHHEFIDRMVAALEKADLKVATIDGRVAMGKRDAIKNGFQDGDTQVLVCGIRAASEGLTLTASHTVVFMELDWNPSRHFQAEARVDRFGQQVQPTMYYLVGLGTIEQSIAKMIDSKRESVNAALGEGDRTVSEDWILDAILDELLT